MFKKSEEKGGKRLKDGRTSHVLIIVYIPTDIEIMNIGIYDYIYIKIH